MSRKNQSNSPFVSRDLRRKGAWVACIPLCWGSKESLSSYFGSVKSKEPKISAMRWVDKTLAETFGEHRVPYILAIPNLTSKFKYNCNVNIFYGNKYVRDTTYSCLVLSWTTYQCDEKGKWYPHRRQKHVIYNPTNRVEKAHELSLLAARLRAETTYSSLDECVFNFEYDLTGL